MKKTLFRSLALLAATTATNALAHETPSIVRYQPTIDIKQDPGCVSAPRTREERIAHNRMLAELYFINFQSDRVNGRNYGWHTYGCVALDSTVLLGALSALADPIKRPSPPAGSPKSDPNALTGEQRGYFATFPDWGTVPGTLMVIPFDGGAYFRMMYQGHGKDDGKLYQIWETNLILTDQNGKIYHFEMWNDTTGMDATTRKAFGRSINELGLGGYLQATEAYPVERK